MKTVKIATFLKERKSKFKPSEANNSGLQRIAKINFDGNIYLAPIQTNTDMILVKNGDLIISGINVEKGALAIYQGEKDVLASIHYSAYEFDKTQIDIRYLKWFLKSKIFKNLLQEQAGSGIKKEIKSKHLLPIEIELPTLDLQKKIADKILSVDRDIISVNDEISKQEKYISSLHQSILQQAVEGKLCAQNPDDEPASVLLKKIKAEKEKLIAEKKIKKQKDLSPITEKEKPFDLPEGWVWCRLDDILLQLPRNGFSPNRVDYKTNTRVLTLTATTKGILDLNQYKYVEDKIADASYLWLSSNDILVQRSNSIEYVGIACLCDQHMAGYIYPDLMMKLQCVTQVDVKYVLDYLHCGRTRNYFREKAKGTSNTMKKITQGIIANSIIPLPPLAEQQRIVEKVDSLMTFCNELKKEVSSAKEYASQLMQAVLQEAFSSPQKEKQDNVVELEPKEVKEQDEFEWSVAARGTMKEGTWGNLLARAGELANEDS